MGLGLKRRLQSYRICYDVICAKALFTFFGLEAVVLLLKRLNKRSVEAVLREYGGQIGHNCDVESGIMLHNVEADFSNLSIGNFCHIGKEVFLDLRVPILIRERSTISMRTVISTHLDIGHAGPFEEKISRHSANVSIGPGAYIGAGAIILAGVQIGQGSVVGAGSLVNKNVAPRTIVAGVPAREIRKINY